MNQLVEDLKATRDALAANGRCEVVLMNSDGNLCLDGAIGMAVVKGFETHASADAKYTIPGTPHTDYDILSDSIRYAYHLLGTDARAQAVARAIYEEVKDVEAHRAFMTPTRPKNTVAAHAEGDVIKAMWIYNDWTDVPDDEVFAMLDKAILNAGGSL